MSPTKCPRCGSSDIGTMSVGPLRGRPACIDCGWVKHSACTEIEEKHRRPYCEVCGTRSHDLTAHTEDDRP